MVHRVVRSSVGHRMRGGTVLGFLIGLIAGLSIAVVVAMFVTRAPVPFVDKGNLASERKLEPQSLAEAPDPNVPLHAKVGPAQGTSSAPAADAAASGSQALASAPRTAAPSA